MVHLIAMSYFFIFPYSFCFSFVIMNELRRRSVMDITRDSGSFDGGSIPSGDI